MVCLVYVAAYHIPLDGMSLGRDPLVTSFLCDTLRLRPAVHTTSMGSGYEASNPIPGSL